METTKITDKNKDWKAKVKKVMSFLVYPAAIIIPFLLGTQVLLFGFVPTGSMEPTYHAGSFCIANRLIDEANMERGDVVFFQHEGTYLLKRIVGLPGDTITFENCRVHINGELLDESEYLDNSVDTVSLQAEFVVPEGHYFMMGDNRTNSADSRFWDEPYVVADSISAEMMFAIKIPGLSAEE